MNKKIIGYWYSKNEPLYPIPIKDSATNSEILTMTTAFNYFKNNGNTLYCKGSSICRICGENVGSDEIRYKNYIIPGGLLHYINVHKVLVPQLIESYLFINTKKSK